MKPSEGQLAAFNHDKRPASFISQIHNDLPLVRGGQHYNMLAQIGAASRRQEAAIVVALMRSHQSHLTRGYTRNHLWFLLVDNIIIIECVCRPNTYIYINRANIRLMLPIKRQPNAHSSI